MESKKAMIAIAWVTLIVLGTMFITLGGSRLENYLFIGVFFFFNLVFTIVIGLERIPEGRLDTEVAEQLNEMRTNINQLMKMVEDIKKAIEE